jgi:protein SCO1/2
MIRSIARWICALAVITAFMPVAWAHSLDELEATLGEKEKYFQPLDKPAPDFTLRDADGDIARLADFRGKVVVMHFIYASCPDVCPLHAERVAEIQAMVNQTPMKDQIQFISVTTDPSKDTADVLRDYGPAHGLDAVNWIFLTTTPEQPEDATRQLAQAYGHKFAKTPDGYQMHGIVTHVIDHEGRWRANFHGLKFEPVNLVLFVNALVNDDVHPERGHGEESFWDRIRNLF